MRIIKYQLYSGCITWGRRTWAEVHSPRVEA